MNSNPYKFGIITPSQLIVEYTRKITVKQNIDLQVSLSAQQEAIPVACSMEAEGVEVILAGEGTSSVLREIVQVPIVSFSRSYIDFIKGLKEAKKIGNRIVVPIFKAFIKDHNEDINMLAELFNVNIIQFAYSTLTELQAELNEASNKGFDVVFGTGPGILIAQNLGLKTVEAGRSEKDIEISVNTAISVVRSKRMEQEKSERYRCIIEAASDGIIATDNNGIITTANHIAEQILRADNREIIGQTIDHYMPTTSVHDVYTTVKPVYDSIEKVNQKTVVCNHHPFEVNAEIAGCVTTLNEVSNVIRAENKIRRSFSKGHSARYIITDFLYECDKMKELISKVIQFAKTDSSLLISGETGTGKEILSQSIHNLSKRKLKPFVSLNCAALPDQLLESELFGYEEGAFTGSRKGGKPGLFELAHQGTIFLDEIGETPKNVQIRLLRVLQEREIMRLGAEQLVPIDVRVIAATNKDLSQEVQAGTFREDLFFRLNVLQIHIPPVRERLEDIPTLIHAFIRDFSKEHHLKPQNLPSKYLKKMMTYSWPGNVRQLKNFAERLVLMSKFEFKDRIFDEVFSELIQFHPEKHTTNRKMSLLNSTEPIKIQKQKYDIEQIKRTLLETGFSKSKAAEKLGISRTTLWTRLKIANLAD